MTRCRTWGSRPGHRARVRVNRVDVMVSPEGHRTEQVLVQRSLSRPPKPYLRVRLANYFIQDCSTVAEVAQLVDLATLVPEQK